MRFELSRVAGRVDAGLRELGLDRSFAFGELIQERRGGVEGRGVG